MTRHMLIRVVCVAGLLLAMLWTDSASAHEIRPAYLQIELATNGHYQVLWKVPRIDQRVPDITPRFDPALTLVERGEPFLIDGFAIFHYRLDGARGIEGSTITIDGLQQTTIDVLVDVQTADGGRHSLLLGPTHSTVKIPTTPAGWGVVATYVKLGIEHILLGIDHLLFVLALILITRGGRNIVRTITAFTLAHSITLSAAALGLVHVPQTPVEATIALSILFLALEILRGLRGEPTMTSRKPWLVAFTFGLLHGLGFAGALAEIGLPPNEIPLALASFNIGVELGQLAFVFAVLALMQLVRSAHVDRKRPAMLRRAPAYAIGAISAYWVIERIAAFALSGSTA